MQMVLNLLSIRVLFCFELQLLLEFDPVLFKLKLQLSFDLLLLLNHRKPFFLFQTYSLFLLQLGEYFQFLIVKLISSSIFFIVADDSSLAKVLNVEIVCI